MATRSLTDLHAQIAQLEAKAAELRKQREEIRNEERDSVIDELRTKIAEHGLTAADLKLGASKRTAKRATTTTKSPQ